LLVYFITLEGRALGDPSRLGIKIRPTLTGIVSHRSGRLAKASDEMDGTAKEGGAYGQALTARNAS